MNKIEKQVQVKGITKKEARKVIFEKLSGALAEYKNKLDKKKFESKLKKASKLFAVDIAKASRKNSQEKKAKKAEPAVKKEMAVN